MKRVIILTFINIFLLLFYYCFHKNINLIHFFTFSSIFLLTPLIISSVVYLFKNYLFLNSLFYVSIMVTFLLTVIIVDNYKNSNIPDLNFDFKNVNSRQTLAEERTRNFILSNSTYPKSYTPIKFGNLEQVNVYELNANYSLARIHQELEKGNQKTFKRLLDLNTKQKLNIIEYDLPHSYELKDKNAIKHRCLASISLDSNLNIIRIDNNEDWIIKFWNEPVYNSEAWEKEFKK